MLRFIRGLKEGPLKAEGFFCSYTIEGAGLTSSTFGCGGGVITGLIFVMDGFGC